MKLKPILILSLLLIATFGIPKISDVAQQFLNSKTTVKEGYHPKNVNLATLSITCPDSQEFFVDANCRANVSIDIPSSICNVSSITYSIDGGPIGIIHSGSTMDTFFVGVDTFNIVWNIAHDCGPVQACTQEIQIRDNIFPTLDCPDDVRVGNRPDGRKGLRLPKYPVLMRGAAVLDNCSNFNNIVITNDYNNTDDASDEYPLGETIVWFTATDASMNSTQCSVSVVVFDNTPPTIVCPDTLFTDCVAPLPYRNIREFIAARGRVMDETALDSMSFLSRDTIADSICVHKKIIHRLYAVSDTNNNSDTCVQVIIINDIKPPVIRCKDITVHLDSNGLATIDADSLDNGSSDNCQGRLTFSTIPTRLSFNCDDIVLSQPLGYTLVVTDECGNSSSCSASITVIDPRPFTERDITWPQEDVYFDGCNVAVPPTSVTGSPILNNQPCSMTAATYKDQSFDHPIYCKYIRRTWSVIDWRQYKLNTPGSPGRWTFVQNIYVTNSQAPDISASTCQNQIICTPDNACVATVTFEATGTDDCLPVDIQWSYQLDLNSNGTIDISGLGSTLTRTYAQGTHRLTWEAKDGCGNIDTCSFDFEVRDCKKPSAITKQGLAINLQAGMAMAEIDAKAFDNLSSDNCTPRSQLKFSFSADVNDTLKLFNCQSLGRRQIEFWVTDLAGNQTRTNTFIDVQDNHDQCGSSRIISIAGSVYTEENIHMPDVKIMLEGAEFSRELKTDENGKYCFEKLKMYNDYYISSAKSENLLEGVSTLDLVLIQRHILGLEELNSPYKLIASDVNNSQSLTASDLTELRKMILGLKDTFEYNNPWRFVNANFVFEDNSRPWTFDEAMIYESLDASMLSSDFIAIKIGDVNGTVSQNMSHNTFIRNSPVTLNIEEKRIESNVWETLPVTIKSDENIVGMQWTLELSDEILELAVEPGAFNITESNLGYISKGNTRYLTFSYNETDGVPLSEGDVLFSINLLTSKEANASQLLTLNNVVASSECYDDNFVESHLRLSFDKNIFTEQIEAKVGQNFPNPFKDNTIIKVSSPYDDVVTLSIFDNVGLRIYTGNHAISTGDNFIKITENMLKMGSGKFICKLKSSQFNDIVKMIKIE